MGAIANLRLLLDTHTLLWWVSNHPALSATADHALNEIANDIFVSAASAWEVTTKARLGNLIAGPLAQAFVAESSGRASFRYRLRWNTGNGQAVCPGITVIRLIAC